jgi:acyl carrier protein
VTKTEFYRILDGILELAPGTIQGNERLSDLEGWDSLAVVAFIAAVDKHLHFVVAPKPLVAARSVPDLTALVADKLTS